MGDHLRLHENTVRVDRIPENEELQIDKNQILEYRSRCPAAMTGTSLREILRM